MKNTIVVLLLILSGNVLAQENAVSALESKAALHSIDSHNHIHSIQQRRIAASKAGGSNDKSQAFQSILKKTFELLASSNELLGEVGELMNGINVKDPLALFGRVNGKESYYVRLSIVKREVTCSEFSLYLMSNEEGVLPNESLALATTVLKECRRINFGEPVIDAAQAAQQKKLEAEKKINNKKG